MHSLFQTFSNAMNDDRLESLLQSMQPVAPGAELTQRVERDLALAAMFRTAKPAEVTQPKRTPWYVPATWATLGAAAAVLVMSALPPAAVPAGNAVAGATVSNPAVLPVNTSREFVDVQEGSITYPKADAPQRQLRVRAVERHQWVDPRDGAQYTVEVPVENDVTLPVKFQ